MSTKLFARLNQGVANKGNLYDFRDLEQNVTTKSKDWYRGLFYYNQEQYNLFYERNSDGLRGCSGITDVVTDNVVFDFDKNDKVKTLEEVRADVSIAIMLLRERYNITPNQFTIFFSGNKGFSIEFRVMGLWTPEKVKYFSKTIIGSLPSADTKVYNASRIFRYPGTKHQSSGLFKISLLIEHLNGDINKIKQNASECKHGDPILFKEPINFDYDFRENVSEKIYKPGDLDFSQKPKWLSTCLYAILNGRFPNGQRNECLMALASSFRKNGFPEAVTRLSLYGASSLQAALSGTEEHSRDDIDKEIITTVYKDTWKLNEYTCDTNEVLKSICDSFPGYECDMNKVSTGDMVTLTDISDRFLDFSINIEKNKIYTGLDELDKRITLTTSMPVGILASPGSGKTAIAMNILKNSALQGLQSIFCSLDMSSHLVTARMLGSEYNLGFEELIALARDTPAKYRELAEAFNYKYKNINLTFKSATMVSDMRRMIETTQDRTGEKVKLVLIDYFELIASDKLDDMAGAKQVMNGLKDMTTDLDVCSIVLLQPQKSAGDASCPITSMRQIKGSSILEQTLRVIFGLYREGFDPSNPEGDKFLTLNCIKNTMGPLFSLDFAWDGKRGSVDMLSPSDRHQLMNLREHKKTVRDKENKW